jgi:ribonuclease HI
MPPMRWVKRTLRGKDVFARADATGAIQSGADGRVAVVYNQSPGAKVYRAGARNLEGDSTEVVEFDVDELGGPADPGDAIIAYTDGACTGNPGPAGVGVVLLDGPERREISEYLGPGTNNIAELTAILRALEAIPAEQRDRAIRLHTDSSYAVGLLTKNWKAKANGELVAELRTLARLFPRLNIIKVKAHSGVPENERADQLAVDAIRRR